MAAGFGATPEAALQELQKADPSSSLQVEHARQKLSDFLKQNGKLTLSASDADRMRHVGVDIFAHVFNIQEKISNQCAAKLRFVGASYVRASYKDSAKPLSSKDRLLLVKTHMRAGKSLEELGPEHTEAAQSCFTHAMKFWQEAVAKRQDFEKEFSDIGFDLHLYCAKQESGVGHHEQALKMYRWARGLAKLTRNHDKTLVFSMSLYNQAIKLVKKDFHEHAVNFLQESISVLEILEGLPEYDANKQARNYRVLAIELKHSKKTLAQALNAVEKSIQLQSRGEALFLKVQVLCQLDRFAEAAGALTALLEHNDCTVLLGISACQAMQDQSSASFEQTVPHLEKLLEKFAGDVSIRVATVQLALKHKHLDRIRSEVELIIPQGAKLTVADRTELCRVIWNLSAEAFQAKELAVTLDWLRKYEVLLDRDDKANISKALCSQSAVMLAMNEVSEALVVATAAHSILPSAAASTSIIRAHLAMGDAKKAKQQLEALKELVSKYPPGHLQFEELLTVIGDEALARSQNDVAVAVFSQLLEDFPKELGARVSKIKIHRVCVSVVTSTLASAIKKLDVLEQTESETKVDINEANVESKSDPMEVVDELNKPEKAPVDAGSEAESKEDQKKELQDTIVSLLKNLDKCLAASFASVREAVESKQKLDDDVTWFSSISWNAAKQAGSHQFAMGAAALFAHTHTFLGLMEDETGIKRIRMALLLEAHALIQFCSQMEQHQEEGVCKRLAARALTRVGRCEKICISQRQDTSMDKTMAMLQVLKLQAKLCLEETNFTAFFTQVRTVPGVTAQTFYLMAMKCMEDPFGRRDAAVEALKQYMQVKLQEKPVSTFSEVVVAFRAMVQLDTPTQTLVHMNNFLQLGAQHLHVMKSTMPQVEAKWSVARLWNLGVELRKRSHKEPTQQQGIWEPHLACALKYSELFVDNPTFTNTLHSQYTKALALVSQ